MSKLQNEKTKDKHENYCKGSVNHLER